MPLFLPPRKQWHVDLLSSRSARAPGFQSEMSQKRRGGRPKANLGYMEASLGYM